MGRKHFAVTNRMKRAFLEDSTLMLEELKLLTYNTAREHSMMLKFLDGNTEIRIIQANKGIYAIKLKEHACKWKICRLADSGFYEILRKNAKPRAKRKVPELHTKHKKVQLAVFKYKPTNYHKKT
jgi:hypothetical protein